MADILSLEFSLPFTEIALGEFKHEDVETDAEFSTSDKGSTVVGSWEVLDVLGSTFILVAGLGLEQLDRNRMGEGEQSPLDVGSSLIPGTVDLLKFVCLCSVDMGCFSSLMRHGCTLT